VNEPAKPFLLWGVLPESKEEIRAAMESDPIRLILDKTAQVVRSGLTDEEKAHCLEHLRAAAKNTVIDVAHAVDQNTQTAPPRLGRLLDLLSQALEALLQCEAQLGHLTTSPRGRGEPGK
jgi:hypothetical protein